MKMKAQSSIFIVQLTLVGILFTACFKRIEPKEFTEDELAWMPYTEDKTLQLISEDSDTMQIFISKFLVAKIKSAKSSGTGRLSKAYNKKEYYIGGMAEGLYSLVKVSQKENKQIVDYTTLSIMADKITLPIQSNRRYVSKNRTYDSVVYSNINDNNRLDSIVIAKYYGIVAVISKTNKHYQL
jgi:hypothetical protein